MSNFQVLCSMHCISAAEGYPIPYSHCHLSPSKLLDLSVRYEVLSRHLSLLLSQIIGISCARQALERCADKRMRLSKK